MKALLTSHANSRMASERDDKDKRRCKNEREKREKEKKEKKEIERKSVALLLLNRRGKGSRK